MNPYRKLVSDTMLFGVSMFAARFLTFLLTPLYTRLLTSAEYGVADLLLQTGSLLIQITSAGIANAVVRYGLAPGRDRSAVFTTGLLVSLAGVLLLLPFLPLLNRVEVLSGKVWWNSAAAPPWPPRCWARRRISPETRC